MFDRLFPRLTQHNSAAESPVTPRYNCVAWAVHNDLINIWPDTDGSWPVQLPRQETVQAFIDFFGILGFEECVDDRLEPQYEKIAIYALNGVPQHVARQKACGRWASKLAVLVDIWHATPDVLVNYDAAAGGYGAVVKIMRRNRNLGPIELPEMFPPQPPIILP